MNTTPPKSTCCDKCAAIKNPHLKPSEGGLVLTCSNPKCSCHVALAGHTQSTELEKIVGLVTFAQKANLPIDPDLLIENIEQCIKTKVDEALRRVLAEIRSASYEDYTNPDMKKRKVVRMKAVENIFNPTTK